MLYILAGQLGDVEKSCKLVRKKRGAGRLVREKNKRETEMHTTGRESNF